MAPAATLYQLGNPLDRAPILFPVSTLILELHAKYGLVARPLKWMTVKLTLESLIGIPWPFRTLGPNSPLDRPLKMLVILPTHSKLPPHFNP